MGMDSVVTEKELGDAELQEEQLYNERKDSFNLAKE
jgi:hypothetical protein